MALAAKGLGGAGLGVDGAIANGKDVLRVEGTFGLAQQLETGISLDFG
jgi:hypothetical protein